MSKKVICIGSVLIDELYFCKQLAIAATSNPATLKREVGGVVSNIARHLSMLEVDIEMLTSIGNDSDATMIEDLYLECGISLKHALKTQTSTGRYASVLNPDGSLYTAVCSDLAEFHLTIDYLERQADILTSAHLIICDTNLSVESLNWIITFCKDHQLKLIIEPVSVPKSGKLSNIDLNGIFMITPNEDELKAIARQSDEEKSMIETLLKRGVQNIWLRKGASGSCFYNHSGNYQLGVTSVDVIDSTGAGDAALSAWVFAYLQDWTLSNCMEAGHSLAMEVIQQKGAVLNELNSEILSNKIQTYYGAKQ